jgi:L-threonylcarbamoyladenylate synthase
LTLGAKILRPGLILPSNISRILKKKVKIIKNTKNIKSPGQLKKHYSPGIPIKLNQKKIKKNIAFIAFGKKYKTGKNIFNLSYKSDLNEAARNLYRILRTIKNCHYKMIYVSKIPQKGIGIAINDRLNRAAN